MQICLNHNSYRDELKNFEFGCILAQRIPNKVSKSTLEVSTFSHAIADVPRVVKLTLTPMQMRDKAMPEALGKKVIRQFLNASISQVFQQFEKHLNEHNLKFIDFINFKGELDKRAAIQIKHGTYVLSKDMVQKIPQF